MSTGTERNHAPVEVPPGQLRDGILLMLLGVVVATLLDPTGDPAAARVGSAIAVWGLVLVGQAVWLRSRRRT